MISGLKMLNFVSFVQWLISLRLTHVTTGAVGFRSWAPSHRNLCRDFPKTKSEKYGAFAHLTKVIELTRTSCGRQLIFTNYTLKIVSQNSEDELFLVQYRNTLANSCCFCLTKAGWNTHYNMQPSRLACYCIITMFPIRNTFSDPESFGLISDIKNSNAPPHSERVTRHKSVDFDSIRICFARDWTANRLYGLRRRVPLNKSQAMVKSRS